MIQSTSRADSPSSQQAPTPEQSPAGTLRDLVAQCLALASRYRATPEATLEQTWWLSLRAAGVRLRDTLEEHRDRWERLGLTDKEVERAYYTLMHVAYYFEPGGVAEHVFQEQGWVWSDESEQ